MYISYHAELGRLSLSITQNVKFTVIIIYHCKRIAVYTLNSNSNLFLDRTHYIIIMPFIVQGLGAACGRAFICMCV